VPAREAPLHHQSEGAKHALGQEICADGNDFRIRMLFVSQGPTALIQLVFRVPSLPTAFCHVGLVSLPIQWTLLPLHSTTIWLDCVPLLVLQIGQPVNAAYAAQNESSSTYLAGRLSHRARGRNYRKHRGWMSVGISVSRHAFCESRALRHAFKVVWGSGATLLELLGLVIGTVAFRYFISPEKLLNLQEMAAALLNTVRKRSR